MFFIKAGVILAWGLIGLFRAATGLIIAISIEDYSEMTTVTKRYLGSGGRETR